jgi:hypothetical protein
MCEARYSDFQSSRRASPGAMLVKAQAAELAPVSQSTMNEPVPVSARSPLVAK